MLLMHWADKNAAITMHCNLKPRDSAPVPIRFNFRRLCQVWSCLAYRLLSCSVFLLIRYVTLWPWPLTPWSWTCVVDWVSCVQPMSQTWARLINTRLSYWRLTTGFLSVLGVLQYRHSIFKTRGPTCTKFSGGIPGHRYTSRSKMVLSYD